MAERVMFQKSDDSTKVTAYPLKDDPNKTVYLDFTNNDVSDNAVQYIIQPLGNNLYSIQSCSAGKFWKRDSTTNWIVVNYDKDGSDFPSDAQFELVPTSGDLYKIKNVGNEYYLKIESGGIVFRSLKADTDDDADAVVLKKTRV